MSTLAIAARASEAQSWASYESSLNERDAIEQMEVDKYEEIKADPELMHEAMTHLYLSSDENQRLVENTNHALDVATRGSSNEAILEAAVGIADLRDKAAAMYAEHLVSASTKH